MLASMNSRLSTESLVRNLIALDTGGAGVSSDRASRMLASSKIIVELCDRGAICPLFTILASDRYGRVNRMKLLATLKVAYLTEDA